MSTAIILEKEDVVIEVLEFITSLNFNVVKEGTKILVFEVAIRHFAGMISAWDLLHGPFSHLAKSKTLRKSLYEQMIVLGDVMVCAFKTASGIPGDWVDPANCRVDQGMSNSLAGAGTIILEMARLSDITGDMSYVHAAQRAEAHLIQPEPQEVHPGPGLLGSRISLENGAIMNVKGSWGALSDCEYKRFASRLLG